MNGEKPQPGDAAPRRRPGAHKAPRKKGRLLVAAGLVLTCVGIVLVGYSQLGAAREAAAATAADQAGATELRQTVMEIRSRWARGLRAGEPGLLRIPRFDRGGAEFVAPIVAGWEPEDLARGIGLFEDGARPGEPGNVVLAGHRITHGSPFARFPALEVGDLVEVATRSKVVTYRLITDGTRYRVPDTTAWPTWSTPDPTLGVDVPTTQHYLTLVTCAETFHTELRSVAVGIQVATRPNVAHAG